VEKVTTYSGTDPLHMSGRHFGQPVDTVDRVRVVVAIMQQLSCGAEAWGTYQYAGADPVSLYKLGLEIAATLPSAKQPRLIDEEASWLRLEPTNAILNCKKIRHTFGIQQRLWRDPLYADPEA